MIGHAEIRAIMRDIRVKLFEAAFIKQDIKPFASGQASLGVLRIDTLLPTTQFRRRATCFQFSNIGRHGIPHKQLSCTKLWHPAV